MPHLHSTLNVCGFSLLLAAGCASGGQAPPEHAQSSAADGDACRALAHESEARLETLAQDLRAARARLQEREDAMGERARAALRERLDSAAAMHESLATEVDALRGDQTDAWSERREPLQQHLAAVDAELQQIDAAIADAMDAYAQRATTDTLCAMTADGFAYTLEPTPGMADVASPAAPGKPAKAMGMGARGAKRAPTAERSPDASGPDPLTGPSVLLDIHANGLFAQERVRQGADLIANHTRYPLKQAVAAQADAVDAKPAPARLEVRIEAADSELGARLRLQPVDPAQLAALRQQVARDAEWVAAGQCYDPLSEEAEPASESADQAAPPTGAATSADLQADADLTVRASSK